MKRLHLPIPESFHQPNEQVIRELIAIGFVVALVVFYVWFIASHLEQLPD